MHYTKPYTQPTKKERLAAALADCKEFMGDSWQALIDGIRDCWVADCKGKPLTHRYRYVRGILNNIVGICGRYPVSACMRAALIRVVEPIPAHEEVAARYVAGKRTVH